MRRIDWPRLLEPRKLCALNNRGVPPAGACKGMRAMTRRARDSYREVARAAVGQVDGPGVGAREVNRLGLTLVL